MWTKVLPALFRVAGAFAKVPRTVYLGLVVAAMLFAGVRQVQRWDTARLATAAQTARDAERAKAGKMLDAYAQQMLPLLLRKDSIVRVVDTLRLAATAHASDVATAIATVPDAVRDSQPTVDAALTACETLVVDVQRLTAAQLTERVVYERVHTLDTATIRSQATMLVAKSDTIAAKSDTIAIRTTERDRKPGWGTVVKVGTVAVGTGVAIGKYVLKAKRVTR